MQVVKGFFFKPKKFHIQNSPQGRRTLTILICQKVKNIVFCLLAKEDNLKRNLKLGIFHLQLESAKNHVSSFVFVLKNYIPFFIHSFLPFSFLFSLPLFLFPSVIRFSLSVIRFSLARNYNRLWNSLPIPISFYLPSAAFNTGDHPYPSLLETLLSSGFHSLLVFQ